jgi:hypothetical protein
MNEREVARELLRELIEGALGGSNGHSAAADAATPAGPPQVPAPPVAAVLRPSTWSRPAADGELIGAGLTEAPASDHVTESVAIDSDSDLERFVCALAGRLEDAGTRAAIRSGRLRFSLRRGDDGASRGGGPGGVMRIERGAVTERTVDKAAKAGARLVLAPGAVATPLAREKARALGIEIEWEPRC